LPEFLTHPVNPELADGVWAILMMGMALLMWGRFRNMRGEIKRRKAQKREAELKAQQREDHPGPWTE
jgi:hypothetical protein